MNRNQHPGTGLTYKALILIILKEGPLLASLWETLHGGGLARSCQYVVAIKPFLRRTSTIWYATGIRGARRQKDIINYEAGSFETKQCLKQILRGQALPQQYCQCASPTVPQ